MKTKLQLLRNEAAHITVTDMDWWQVALIWTGALFWLLASLVALFVLIDVLTERRWLRAGKALTDPDVPKLQGIVSPHEIREWNRTNTLSFEDFRRETNE